MCTLAQKRRQRNDEWRKEGMNAEAESKSGVPQFISVWPTKW
ncbi:unnamed protein product [Tetraodon nigroviridis]|uniref:(spotted green pufferfish) hypothetical protein n=1 Tax=Tetraodon nigroviridis TaxID=99883 RepID=Q4SL23_TETNG|nr:unnamed protein product [Tetraodon nigroviridis]